MSAETCNTHNMLKLTRHIFGWSASARAMDFYERALAQPHSRVARSANRRHVVLCFAQAGAFQGVQHTGEFILVRTGTGIENHARYGEAIYARTEDALYVNLFIPSEVIWAERGLMLAAGNSLPQIG